MSYPILSRRAEPASDPAPETNRIFRVVIGAIQDLDHRVDGIEQRRREPADDVVLGDDVLAALGDALKAIGRRLDTVEGVVKKKVLHKIELLEAHNKPRARYRPEKHHDPELLDRVRELQNKLK